MKTLRLVLAVFAVSLLAASSASAASTFGRTFAPAIDTLPTPTNFVVSASDGSQAAKQDGIITSFSHVSEVAPEPWIKLAIFRQVADGFLVVGMSDQQTLMSSVLGVWPTRIPVKQGDLIGVSGPSAGLAAASPSAEPLDVFMGVNPAIPLTAGTLIPNADVNDYDPYALDIAATVESDADADGFGDETQDGCPTDATTQGPCDTVGPKLSLKNKRVKRGATSISFTVKSNEIATLSVSGSFKAGKKKFKIKRITRSLAAGSTVTIKVSVPSKAKSKLKSGSTLKGSLTATATDSKGNKSTYTSKPRILPKN